jgi:hypothetical protein
MSFSLAQRKELKETSTLTKASPYMERMQTNNRSTRRLFLCFGIAGHAMRFLSAARREKKNKNKLVSLDILLYLCHGN